MICSHYEVLAYDYNNNILATTRAFSFDEAYCDIDDMRERLNERVVKFVLKIPDEEIEKIKKENKNEHERLGEERSGNSV